MARGALQQTMAWAEDSALLRSNPSADPGAKSGAWAGPRAGPTPPLQNPGASGVGTMRKTFAARCRHLLDKDVP
jgi:hypothetical protein